jgi:alpha-tubulin suppressor-like RCC1 family protein
MGNFKISKIAQTTQKLSLPVGQSTFVSLDNLSYAYAWGLGTGGQIGDNTILNKSSPVSVVGGRQWIQLCGQTTSVTYGLDSLSYAYAWGLGASGALGTNTIVNRSSPTSIVGGKQFIKLYGTVTSGYGLDSLSYAWAWGLNSFGQLGDNTNNNQSSPVSVVGGKQWQYLVTLPTLTTVIGLDSLSYAYAWGRCDSGQAGDNTVTNKSSPTSVSGGRQWLQLARAYQNVMGLDSLSYAYAWGAASGAGNIGDNANVDRSSPVSVVGGRQFTKLINNVVYTSYAIDSNGAAFAWGIGTSGECGDNGSVNRSSPVSVSTTRRFKTLSPESSCLGIDQNGKAWAWGYNINGQLGTNSLANATVPTQISPGMNWSAIMSADSQYTSFGVDSEGNLWSWGLNTTGWLGDNTIQPRSSPVAVTQKLPPARSDNFAVVQVFPNAQGAIALNPFSYAYAWGLGTTGQLGDNTLLSKSFPVSVVGGRQWLTISGNCDVSLPQPSVVGLDNLSYAYAWGFNDSGQLGINTVVAALSPTSVVGGKQFTQITCTAYKSVTAIDSLSYAWAWGLNTNGWLGDNTTQPRSSPTSVLGGKQWLFLQTVSNNYTCGIDNLSYAWAWGNNGIGQLGDNTILSKSSPISVVGGKQWQALFCLISFTNVGLDNLSYAWAWGQNNTGLLGDNTILSKSSPVSVVGGRQFIKLATNVWSISAPTNVCGLETLSYAYAWGNNTSGQLGDNTVSPRSSPVSVVGGRQFRQIIQGTAYTVALDNLSYAWAWGLNSSGQLGDNTLTNRSSPVSVVGGIQFVSINTFNNSAATVAVDSNKNVWTWGDNTTNPTLGDNTFQNRSSPVLVTFINPVFSVAPRKVFGI